MAELSKEEKKALIKNERISVEDINCLNFWIIKLRFLLLLPLAFIGKEDIQSVRENITEQMRNYFPGSLCENVSGCIVSGLE